MEDESRNDAQDVVEALHTEEVMNDHADVRAI